MRNLIAWLGIFVLGACIFAPLLAQGESAEAAAPGAQGVDTPWDHETVDLLTGAVHLDIPLYTAHSGDMFDWSVILSYNGNTWDSTDTNYPSTGESYRHPIGFGPAGFGWNVSFGRVYSVTYSSGGSTETYYYFQGQKGDTHRLFRKGETHLEWKFPMCHTPGCPQVEVCGLDPYWYAFDGSGIRAQSNLSDPEASTSWTVWYPNGSNLTLDHVLNVDPNLRASEAVYHGWYTTRITSPQPKSGDPYNVSITYYPASSNADLCPQTVTDSSVSPPRVVTFNCSFGYYVYDNGFQGFYGNGVINSIDVPAPSSPSGIQRYQFQYTTTAMRDPFSAVGTYVDNVLFLQSVTAVGVSPPHTFTFDYTSYYNPNVGELNDVRLPGGGERVYYYSMQNVWRPNYPIIYTGPPITDQFKYFAIYGVSKREIYDNDKLWVWDYTRDNDYRCSGSSPNTDFCYGNPKIVSVKGPYDPTDLSATASITAYTYNATYASVGTPGRKDGTVQKIDAYAGSGFSAPLIRTTTFEYDDDDPNPGCMVVGTFNKAHYADNLRQTRTTTRFADDGQTTHDFRTVDYCNWATVSTSPNFGRFQEIREYDKNGGPSTVCGSSPYYRKTQFSYALTAGQVSNWVLTPITSRKDFDGQGILKSEADYTFDDYGRMISENNLFAPGTMDHQHDLITTYSYDPGTGNQSTVVRQIPSQGGNLGETTLSWSAGYPTKKQVNGLSSWYSMDVDREANWGLPTAVRRPDGTGASISFDSLGRPTTVRPLANSPDPPVDITYESDQVPGFTPTYRVTTVVGDVSSSTSIQTKTILDGLGRVKEQQVLRAGWVSKKYNRDALGNIRTESEWAPVGTTGPVTTTTRSGTYDATGNVFVDPFFRVRKIVGPDGATTLKSYQGLVATTTVQGVQGGTTSSPTSMNTVTTETTDIFGRLVKNTTKMEGATNEDRIVEYTYDVLDHRLETRTTDPNDSAHFQVKSVLYDPLGRVKILTEPERGRVWFGTVTQSGANVDSDGYNALGNVIRYQDEFGYSSVPAYHYRKTYDAAGRLTLVQKEEDVSLIPTVIADYLYDDSGHGTASSQNGQLCRARGYDSATPPALTAQTDYYYTGQFGRFNKMTTSLAGWATPYNIYYSYDPLGQVSSVAYPTTAAADPVSGMPLCSNLTCLTIDRTHGSITHIGSSRGYDMVSSALYNDAGSLQEWVSGNGMKTQILPDSNMKLRPQEIRVTRTSGGTQLWTSGVYSYDGAGFIKGIGSDVFTYDSVGRLKEAQVGGTSGGTVYNQVFSYDPFGNILSKSDTVSPGQPVVTTYDIDPANNRIRRLGAGTNWTYDNDGALRHDNTFDYGYDNARRLKLVQSGGTDKGSYLYDGFGLRVYRKENHGKEVFYFRDADGNVLSQFSRPVNVTGVTPQWDRDFVYFDGKRIAMIEEPAPSAPSWTSSQATATQISLQWFTNPEPDTYGYLVYRKSASETAFSPLFNGTSAITTSGTSYVDSQVTSGTTYTYKIVAVDSAGNLGSDSAARLITAGDTTTPPAPINLTRLAGDCYVDLSWAMPSYPADFAGFNLYKSLQSGTFGAPLNTYAMASNSYEDLDVENGTRYYYRVKAVDTAGNLSGWSNEVNARPMGGSCGGGGGPTPAFEIVRRDDTGIGMAPYAVVGQSAPPVNVLFLHSDHLGSLRLVTNTQGAIVTNHKYLSFGEEIQPMKTLNPYRFAGYERDSESGKDYVMARYFTPTQGRWMTPDPIGEGYGYGYNNPVNVSDPSGLSSGGCLFVCGLICKKSPDYPGPCVEKCTEICDSDSVETEPLELPDERMVGQPGPDPEKPCDYGDINITPPIVNPIVLAATLGIASGGNLLATIAGYVIGQGTGYTFGLQIDHRTGRSYAYFGGSLGADIGPNLVGIPNFGYNRSENGSTGPGVFLAYSVSRKTENVQAGYTKSSFGQPASSFVERGANSSMLGANVQAGILLPTPLRFSKKPCVE